VGVSSIRILGETQGISPVPLSTPTPAQKQETGATPSASPAPSQTPEPTQTPSPLATVSIAPSPTPETVAVGGLFGIGGFALGILIGAMIAAVAAGVIVSRIKKRAKAQKRNLQRIGTLAQGLEVGNAHHIGKRSNQEDSFGISDLNNPRLVENSGVLAVVADGMGGLADGELVSAAAVGTMMREFPVISNDWMPHQKLLYLVQRANDAANEVTGGARNHGGSTLLSVLVRDGKLWFSSVGDSRICLVRGGSLIPLTRPHIYATDLDKRAARGELSFESALADGQRSALTSYVGMGELEALDYSARGLQLLSGDWVLLMTDGVFNTLDDDEIAALLYGEAQSAAERIESRVIARGLPQQDNLTAVVLRIL
jgi:serine/threonine protein phosphatase PrpC